jgi:hypothetical protein
MFLANPHPEPVSLLPIWLLIRLNVVKSRFPWQIGLLPTCRLQVVRAAAPQEYTISWAFLPASTAFMLWIHSSTMPHSVTRNQLALVTAADW